MYIRNLRFFAENCKDTNIKMFTEFLLYCGHNQIKEHITLTSQFACLIFYWTGKHICYILSLKQVFFSACVKLLKNSTQSKEITNLNKLISDHKKHYAIKVLYFIHLFMKTSPLLSMESIILPKNVLKSQKFPKTVPIIVKLKCLSLP